MEMKPVFGGEKNKNALYALVPARKGRSSDRK